MHFCCFPFLKNGSQMTLNRPKYRALLVSFEDENVGTSLCPKLLSVSSELA